MSKQSLPDLFRQHVPTYKGRSWRPFVSTFTWDRQLAETVMGWSPRRTESRLATYLIADELREGATSFRFGNNKTGHGYKGTRSSFCLIAGAYRDGHLTAFYRRLELIGGLHYDLAIFRAVEDRVGRVRKVTLMAMQADVFAARGNSNEKLFKRLQALYDGGSHG